MCFLIVYVSRRRGVGKHGTLIVRLGISARTTEARGGSEEGVSVHLRFSYLPAATENTSHFLSSPQFGIVLSVTSSYLREWDLRLACIVKSYIWVADSKDPVYKRTMLLCREL